MRKKYKILFFDTKPYDREFFDRANEKYGFKIKYLKSHLSYDTAEFSEKFNVVCGFVNDIFDEDVIDGLVSNGVELIALRCAGYNNVDLKAAYKKIKIVRVPEYSPHGVAEHALALMLSLNRKTHRAYYRTRDGNFSLNGLMGFDMYGKTAGIIGTGKIGKCLAVNLKGLGMKVVAYDLYPDEDFASENDIQYVTLDELYSLSNIISLHCPLTKDTDHMINEESIAKMRDGVMIINTGRGKLIKTDALIEGLKDRKVGAAGLDVYEEESEYFFEDLSAEMISDDVLARLLTFPNVLITSHQGFFTSEALTNIANTTLGNVVEYFEGKSLKNEICFSCGNDN